MRLSYTLCGGLGDFILRYLGSPGDRLAHILHSFPDIRFRISDNNPAGADFLRGNPFFHNADTFKEDLYACNRLPNDIQSLSNLNEFQKLVPPLWLDGEEEAILKGLPRPYVAFHPFASGQFRNLDTAFDIGEMAEWTAEASGLPVVVLGREDFGGGSPRVRQVKGSPRLGVKIVEGSAFFLGSHSSMQCAAWVHKIPSLCVGPSHLLFHNMYAPNSFDMYLKPLFDGNVFMMYDQGPLFPQFLDHFLRTATSLSPLRSPEQCRRRIALSDRAWAARHS